MSRVNNRARKSLVTNDYTTATPMAVTMSRGVKLGAEGGKSGVVQHIINELGGSTGIVSALSMYSSLFKSKNKAIRAVEKYLPAAIFAYDIASKISKFYQDNTEVGSKSHAFKQVTIFDHAYFESCTNNMIDMTDEVISWVISGAEDSKEIAVMSIYNMDTFERIDGAHKSSNSAESVSNIGVLCIHKGNKMFIEVSSRSVFGSSLKYVKRIDYPEGSRDRLLDFLHDVSVDFYKSFDPAENIFTYNGKVSVIPRSSDLQFKFFNINYDDMVSEMRKALDTDVRRGYLLVGPPGTGKSTVILQIENDMRDYPIVRASSANFEESFYMDRFFNFVNSIGKCIMVIEDFDSIGVRNDSGVVARLLSFMDDLKDGNNTLFIATMNSTRKVPKAMLRTGRFDRIIDVGIPSGREEVRSIMSSQARNSNIQVGTVSDDIVDRMISEHLTHSDYKDVIVQLMLKDQSVESDHVSGCVDVIVEGKRTIEKYSIDDENEIYRM